MCSLIRVHRDMAVVLQRRRFAHVRKALKEKTCAGLLSVHKSLGFVSSRKDSIGGKAQVIPFLLFRQRDRKRIPLRGGGGGNCAAVQIDDALGDRKPEAAACFGAGAVDLVELVEQMGEDVWRERLALAEAGDRNGFRRFG